MLKPLLFRTLLILSLILSVTIAAVPANGEPAHGAPANGSPATGATTAIGTITSNGRFEMEGATIWNRGTVLDGARVATGSAASRLQLAGGTDLRLGTASTARVFADRLLLENGSVQGAIPTNFRMETTSLGLRVEGNGGQAQIQVRESGKVLVASLQGSLQVRGPHGVLLAHLLEGNALELSASQGGATASTKLTGVLKNKNGKYTLTDEVTGVTAELRGDTLAKYVGKRVIATGDLAAGQSPVAGAEYVVSVIKVQLPSDDPLAAGKISNSSKTGNPAPMSTLAKVGIVGGIAVAGGVSAGIVAAGDDTAPTVSPQPR